MKHIIFLCAATLALTVLAGCGGGGDNDSNSEISRELLAGTTERTWKLVAIRGNANYEGNSTDAPCPVSLKQLSNPSDALRRDIHLSWCRGGLVAQRLHAHLEPGQCVWDSHLDGLGRVCHDGCITTSATAPAQPGRRRSAKHSRRWLRADYRRANHKLILAVALRRG
jgi:hypothetical protein